MAASTKPHPWQERVRGWIPLALLLPGIMFLATACGSLSSRKVFDPAPAVSRLQAGGSLQAEVDTLAQPLIESGEIYGMAIGVLTPVAARWNLGTWVTSCGPPVRCIRPSTT